MYNIVILWLTISVIIDGYRYALIAPNLAGEYALFVEVSAYDPVSGFLYRSPFAALLTIHEDVTLKVEFERAATLLRAVSALTLCQSITVGNIALVVIVSFLDSLPIRD